MNDLLAKAGITQSDFRLDDSGDTSLLGAGVELVTPNPTPKTPLPTSSVRTKASTTKADVGDVENALSNALAVDAPSLSDSVHALFSDEKAKKLGERRKAALDHGMKLLNDMGISVAYDNDGKVLLTDTDGIQHKLEPDDGILDSTGEILGGIGVGMASAAALAATGVATGGAGLAAAVVASALGSAAGNYADQVINSEQSKINKVKLAKAKSVTEKITRAVEAGQESLLFDALLFGLGKSAKAALNTTAGQVVSNAAKSAAKSAVSSVSGAAANALSKEALKRTGISSLVGAGTGAIMGDPIVGLVAGGLTRYGLSKFGKEESKEAAIKGIAEKVKSGSKDIKNILSTKDIKWLDDFTNIDPTTLEYIKDGIEKSGLKLTGTDTDKKVLATLHASPNVDFIVKNLVNINKGQEAQRWKNAIVLSDKAFQEAVSSLATEKEVINVVRAANEGLTRIKNLYEEIGETTRNFKSSNIKYSLGGDGVIPMYKGLLQGVLGFTSPSNEVVHTMPRSARLANLSKAKNQIVRAAMLNANESQKLKDIGIQVSLKDILDLKFDLASIDPSLLGTGLRAEVDNLNKTLDKDMLKILDDNIVEGNVTKEEAAELTQLVNNAQGHLMQYKTLTNNKLYKMLVAGGGVQADKLGDNLLIAASKVADEGSTNELLQLLRVIPSSARPSVEGLILKAATEKALTKSGNASLVNFAALSDTISKLKLESPEAQVIKTMIDGYKITHNNSKGLVDALSATPSTTAGGGGGGVGLSYNLLVKFRTLLANKTFGRLLTMFSPDQGRMHLRLIEQASRALANPFDASASNELAAEFERALFKARETNTEDAVRSIYGNATELLSNIRNTMKEAAEKKLLTEDTSEEAMEQIANVAAGISAKESIPDAPRSLYAKNIDELYAVVEASPKMRNERAIVETAYVLSRLAADTRNLNLRGASIAEGVISRYNKLAQDPIGFSKNSYNNIVKELEETGRGDELYKNAQALNQEAEAFNEAVEESVEAGAKEVEVTPNPDMATTQTDSFDANRDALLANFKKAMPDYVPKAEREALASKEAQDKAVEEFIAKNGVNNIMKPKPEKKAKKEKKAKEDKKAKAQPKKEEPKAQPKKEEQSITEVKAKQEAIKEEAKSILEAAADMAPSAESIDKAYEDIVKRFSHLDTAEKIEYVQKEIAKERDADNPKIERIQALYKYLFELKASKK